MIMRTGFLKSPSRLTLSPQNLKTGCVAVIVGITTGCTDSHSTAHSNRLCRACRITKGCY